MKPPITFTMLNSTFMVIQTLNIWFKDLPKLSTFYLGDDAFLYSETFHPTSLISLKSIEIGNECFMKSNSFIIDGLNALVSLTIGERSFTKYKDMWEKNKKRSFQLTNCASLETIEIGYLSFSDYAGSFEMRNLASLRSIHFGSSLGDSTSFYSASFIVRGNSLLFALIRRSSQSRIDLARKFCVLWSPHDDHWE